MRAIKIALYCTLPLALLLLFACTRTYQDGSTEEVGFIDKAFDIIGGTPARQEKQELSKIPKTGNPQVDAYIAMENARIEKENEAIRKHNEGAKKDKENPDNGLLGILGLIATGTGYGFLNQYLKKQNAEKLRDIANGRANNLSARYQAAKEAVRDDTDKLEKMKRLAQMAESEVKSNQEFIEHNGDTIMKIKEIVKKVAEKAKVS